MLLSCRRWLDPDNDVFLGGSFATLNGANNSAERGVAYARSTGGNLLQGSPVPPIFLTSNSPNATGVYGRARNTIGGSVGLFTYWRLHCYRRIHTPASKSETARYPLLLTNSTLLGPQVSPAATSLSMPTTHMA